MAYKTKTEMETETELPEYYSLNIKKEESQDNYSGLEQVKVVTHTGVSGKEL